MFYGDVTINCTRWFIDLPTYVLVTDLDLIWLANCYRYIKNSTKTRSKFLLSNVKKIQKLSKNQSKQQVLW